MQSCGETRLKGVEDYIVGGNTGRGVSNRGCQVTIETGQLICRIRHSNSTDALQLYIL